MGSLDDHWRGGESLPRESRIRRRREYLRCYREGRRRHGRLATLVAAASSLSQPRVGVTVSRRVGSSVTRHRVKRRIKEIFRRSSLRSRLGGVDLVFEMKRGAGEVSFQDLSREVSGLLRWASEGMRK